MFALHVSRRARDVYHFDESLFIFDGRVIFADIRSARLFAHKINAARPPDKAVRAGDLYALGLLEEYRHAVFQAYRDRVNPHVLRDALRDLSARRLDPETVRGTLAFFLHEFPPPAVYKNRVPAGTYLDAPGFPPRREAALEELLMLRLTNLNPAAASFRELFDDDSLSRETAYLRILSGLREFFETQPPFGPERRNLIDVLNEPVLASPHSLKGQLEYILARWSAVLGRPLPRVVGGLDLLREEEKPGGGPGPSRAPGLGADSVEESLALFGGPAGPRPDEPEPENFSPDVDWMSSLVLIAKNASVWLDQLSRKYGRSIRRLDEIPDEELDALSEAGITGLWLIGLWERSPASRRIKQIMGNPEAAASAYALFDYAIAADLGGEPALLNLKERAGRRGVRLASDMVPNHMGIDSRWVIEHPDWFIGLPEPPFPSYTFNGPDLSWDDRVAIRIEDRYYDRTDAAVVFQRLDKRTGSVRYIYHGNDGTSFPWNDTAQLDFLNPRVREAVLQTILHVARLFPIIRFDAAMTLAKRHFQRLWYPEPGTGGAIPSRAGHGLSRKAFEAAFPAEFWREVVDRTAVEAPGTLLLAEAFWLMEGYFVRTLGMHRVYNSAFMNMLRDEENARYRRVIKDTLEFDPEILKRYVNFMNNPDERTAIDQFGDHDKYFGVCTLLAALPGLPMIGHGQIEGFREKYGMEYRRAYYDETPREDLVARHRREIFPLFRKRALFAGVDLFRLYDFVRPDGEVDENVLVFSNGTDGERALVVYHNRYAETRGWIRRSAAAAGKTVSLAEGLGLPDDSSAWVVFKDAVSGLEYIRGAGELAREGLHLEPAAYSRAVYTGFRLVRDDERRLYARLAAALGGRGTVDVERAAVDLRLRPVQAAFRELANAGFFDWLMTKRIFRPGRPLDPEPGRQAGEKARAFAEAVARTIAEDEPRPRKAIDPEEIAAAARREFETILRLPVLEKRGRASGSRTFQEALRFLKSALDGPAAPGKKPGRRRPGAKPHASRLKAGLDPRTAWISLFCGAVLRTAGRTADKESPAGWIEAWGLDRIIDDAWRETGCAGEGRPNVPAIFQALEEYGGGIDPNRSAAANARRLAGIITGDDRFRRALGLNRWQGIEYFHQEAFDALRWLLAAGAVCRATGSGRGGITAQAARAISRAFAVSDILRKAERKSGFETAKLRAALGA
ncbi:MAG TPA: alpha-amylase family glycosyl hydrolase [Candidatus Aminicenantes bacterium]|nr:MAG: Alpha amylase, catalytic domain [Candidatus Aminicenantes bacterium ADurb.Bin147]HNQ79596.1 alpha-amylase family glycosyl hydrolase [Candidatus Aminicenantes bacterium]